MKSRMMQMQSICAKVFGRILPLLWSWLGASCPGRGMCAGMKLQLCVAPWPLGVWKEMGHHVDADIEEETSVMFLTVNGWPCRCVCVCVCVCVYKHIWCTPLLCEKFFWFDEGFTIWDDTVNMEESNRRCSSQPSVIFLWPWEKALRGRVPWLCRWTVSLSFIQILHPRSLTPCHWKMVVGRLLSYWEGSFSGAILNFQGVWYWW